MPEDPTYVREAKGKLRFFEKAIALVPGFRGYREKNIRRREDERVRKRIYNILEEGNRYLTRVQKYMSSHDLWDLYPLAESLVKKTGRTSQSFLHAPRGFEAFFAADKVKEGELDRAYEKDVSLVDTAVAFSNNSSNLATKVKSGNTTSLSTELEELDGQLDLLAKGLDERYDILHNSIEVEIPAKR